MMTDTSNDALRSLRNDLTRLRALVFEEIQDCGAWGLTCDELEQRLNLSHQTCSARVNDLMKEDRIRDSGIRRATRTGRKAVVWVVR